MAKDTRYYTILDGVQGVGTPLSSTAAEVGSDKERPTTGGTFTNLQVTDKIKKAVEAGSSSDFFYFTEIPNQPDQYLMQAKLPEYGSAGPGKPVFKIRENNNRLLKGIASRFIDEKGVVDFEAGLKFVQELEIRFGLLGPAKSLEDPLSYDADARADAIDWLARELQIPIEECDDFKNFCDASFGNPGEAPFSYGNFTKIWSNWATHGLSVQAELRNENGLFSDILSPEIQNAMGNFVNALNEIKELAKIDPVTEQRMITVTECTGSTTSNSKFAEMARQARREMGENVPEPDTKKFYVDIKAVDVKILGRPQEIQDKLKILSKNPPVDDAEVDKYRSELSALSHQYDEALDEAEALKQKGERKWDLHQAPVLGSFTDENGDVYYLTIEAFAPEMDSYMEHPGMTHGVSIGIFKDEKDFQKYYMLDDPHVGENETTKKIVDAKDRGYFALDSQVADQKDALAYGKYSPLENYAKAANSKTVNEMRRGAGYEGWEKEHQNVLDDPDYDYEPIMGLNLQGVSDLYQINYRAEVQKGLRAKQQIPQEYQEAYGVLLTALYHLNNQTEMYSRAGIRLDNAYDMAKDAGDTNNAKRMEELMDHDLPKQENQVRQARAEAMTFLSGMLYGGAVMTAADKLNENRQIGRACLNQYLKGTGYTAEMLEAAAVAVNGKLLAPTEIRMDVQCGLPEFADEFVSCMGKDSGTNAPECRFDALSPQAKEFAVHSFDQAFDTVFPKEKQKELADKGLSMFDYIFIDGKSASEVYGCKNWNYPEAQKLDYMKMEMMSRILSGDKGKIETAYIDERGEASFLPLNVTSGVPALTNNVKKTAAHQKEETNFENDMVLHIASFIDEKNWELPVSANGILSQDTIEAMKFYRNFNSGMDPEMKTRYGADIIKAITGLEVLDKNGSMNQTAAENLMANVCINGIPFRAAMNGKVTPENFSEMIDRLAGAFADQMDEKTTAPETITLLSKGQMVPLQYMPPEPPPITTKAHFFSSKETKEAYAREDALYKEGVRQQKLWAEKNDLAKERAKTFDDLRKSSAITNTRGREPERVTFADLADSVSRKTVPERSHAPEAAVSREQQKEKEASL